MALTCSDPASLLDAAKCLLCLNAKQHRAIRVYALAVINGGSLVPPDLAEAAKAFEPVDERHRKALRLHFLKVLSGMPSGTQFLIADDGTPITDDNGDFILVMP